MTQNQEGKTRIGGEYQGGLSLQEITARIVATEYGQPFSTEIDLVINEIEARLTNPEIREEVTTAERHLAVLGLMKEQIGDSSLGRKINQLNETGGQNFVADEEDVKTMALTINKMGGLIRLKENGRERLALTTSTLDHINGVRLLARNVAQALKEKGIKENGQEINPTHIEFLALIHDIGRIFTPARMYTIRGACLLRDLGFPQSVWQIASHHIHSGAGWYYSQTEMKPGREIARQLAEMNKQEREKLFNEL